MSKVHEDNAGYVGVSYEETQDPFYSYNKLSLPLSESDKTVIREEQTFVVTQVNSKFVIDGTSQATVSLAEGNVYIFDQSDSSNAGHPLRFSETADGTHGGGQEYTPGVTANGTPGQAGAQTKIVVPFGAPDLYYYCSVHPGYGSSAATPANRFMFDGALPILTTTDAFGKTLGSGNNEDPYAANLVLALPMNGANNGTTFPDKSAAIRGTGSAKGVNVNGDTKTSTAESNFYGSSGYFDGNGDNLAVPDSSDWNIGSGDFTIEFWMYQVSITNTDAMLVNQWGLTGTSGTWYIKADSLTGLSTKFRSDSNLNNSATEAEVTGSITSNTWEHIAVTRGGNTLRLFVNGKLQGTSAFSFTVPDAPEPLKLGMQSYTSYRNGQPFNGYMQDFRFYKGAAKYTSDFIPPNPINLLDLSGNSNNARNTGVTWQTSVEKFYGGAVAFDNSHITIEEAADFDFGGDFCFETWYYGNGFATQGGTTNLICSTQTLDRFQIWNASDYSFRIYLDATTIVASPANSLGHNAWHHLAATREGSTVRLFIDGSQVASGTNSSSIDVTNLYIGTQYRNGAPGYHYMKAMLQDLRIYKDHAKYTSSFSPPERSVQGTARRYPSGIYVVS